MVVGVGRAVLLIPENDSLKGKRSILRRIKDRAANQFNVSIAEVDALDLHQRAVLGFAVVSNDTRHANEQLDRIFSFIAAATEAQLLDRHMELIHLKD